MLNKSIFLMKDKTALGLIAVYIFFLLLICSRMSPWYFTNEWSDVNLYFNFGKALFNGRILYTEVFDHKGPFIYFLYGIGYLISPHSFFGMFILECLAWIIMTFFLYKIGKLYLDSSTAYIAALISPIFIVKIMKGGGSAEEFILVCMVVSLYYFISYFKEKNSGRHKPSVMFLHGILCSIVLLSKLNLIAFWFFPLAGIFVYLLSQKEYKNILLNLLAFFAGALLLAFPILVYLFANNALEEAYNIYVLLNAKYAEVRGLDDTILLLISRISFLYFDSFPLFFMSLFGIFYFPIKCIGNRIGKISIILAGLLLYTVIYMSLVFQMYYPIPFLVFSSLGVIGLFCFVSDYVKVVRITRSYVLVMSLTMLYIGYSQITFEGTKIYEYIFSDKPGLMTQDMHDIILQEKEEDRSLLSIGYGLGNSLFTTCEIIPNIRYFVSPNLDAENYPQMREQQEKYIENKEINFVLISHGLELTKDRSRKADPERERRRKIKNYSYFNELPALAENYNLVYSDTIKNYIDEYSLEVFRLYKLK